MCFSETQSYVHAILLVIGSILVRQNWRLSAPLFFLALKDLLQGYLYKNQDNPEIQKRTAILSWIHICFQPLFVNLFMSHFVSNKESYNIVLILSTLFGLWSMTNLEELDIQNDPNCQGSDFCQPTGAYIGKYHVGYHFQLDDNLFPVYYFLILLLPALFTDAKKLVLLWAGLIAAIALWSKNNGLKVGEYAAIWCYGSILYYLPIALLITFAK